MSQNNEPTDPYENQNNQQRKKNRMKQLQKSRFQAELDPAISMNSGMQNMDISTSHNNMNTSGAKGPNISSANVPQDMHIPNQEPTYQDNSPSRDYTKLDTLNNMDKGSLAKPK
jgi:hypothetical protein